MTSVLETILGGVKHWSAVEEHLKAPAILRRRCLFCLCLLAPSLVASTGQAQVPAAPPNTGGPTEVEIGVYVITLDDVDERAQAFVARAILELRWKDPRLAFTSETEGEQKTFVEDLARAELQRIWWPDIEVVNELLPRKPENLVLRIFPDGTVEYRERFDATLAVDLDLRNFPLDRQSLVIQIESPAFSASELRFVPYDDRVGLDDEAHRHLVEWRITGYDMDVEETSRADSESEVSLVTYLVDLDRRVFSYAWRLFIPFAFFVLLSTCVFWLERDSLDRRVSIVFSAILTAVAFSFVATRELPHVPYLTLLDKLIVSSYLMAGAAVVCVISLERAKRRGRESLWAKGNEIARYAVPALYVSVWVVVTLIELE